MVTLREKCSVFLFRISPYLGRIRRFTKSPYSAQIQENTDQKKIRIWTPETQCKQEV